MRRALLLTILFGIAGTVVLIAQMSLLSTIVSLVFLSHGRLASLGVPMLLLAGAILVHALLVWLREFTALQGAIRVKSDLRARLLTHLFALGPAYCKGERTGELATTATAGIERLDAYFSRYLPQVYLSALVPLLIVTYILPLDWASAVLLLVTGPIIPLLMILVGSYAEAHIQRQWVALARMSAHFLDVVQGLSTLKLFGRSIAERERVARISNGFRDRTLRVLRVAFLSGMVLEFLSAVAIGLVAVTLGVRLLNGGISFEVALLILLLTPEFYRPLRELGQHRHAGMEGKAAAQRIIEILQTPIPADITTTPIPTLSRQLTLSLNALTYTYPDSSRPALNTLTLTLPAGTCTALVGRSGAGKSTLVNLLMRFISAESGEIAVNATALAEFPLEFWREAVALVPQRPYLFDTTILANIRLARPGASDEDVVRAAELAGAAEFIDQLPQRYATCIGEQGARLSAGQAQRIAIARAFLKDAPVLILDEPTSSLDPQSETLVRQAIERLLVDRTVLVVAHRLNTIANADQIAVLEDGSLVELGHPAELLQRDGAYSRLMRAYRTGGELPV